MAESTNLDFFLESDDESQDDGEGVFRDFLEQLGNGELKRYKTIIQFSNSADGGKSGQSVYGHVIDLVSVAEKLRPAVGLSSIEMRCLLLALTVHDLNKIPGYAPPGSKYADVATEANIKTELEKLEAHHFFPQWLEYLGDIKFLAHAHQESATKTISMFDRRGVGNYKLPYARLNGPLANLMKACDSADNSHSGDYLNPHEVSLRTKLIEHINAAAQGGDRQYRFVGHRLAELRGLFTNVIHEVTTGYFKERYGESACIDLLYYPTGNTYLLDKRVPLNWDDQALQELTAGIEQALADIQLGEIAKFIKSTNSGIMVDDAAISSRAPIEKLFGVITAIVYKKQYKAEFREAKIADFTKDFSQALSNPETAPDLKAQLESLVQNQIFLPDTDERLKLGEFCWAYHNFLNRHFKDKVKTPWVRVYKLFNLPEEKFAVYNLTHAFRRGYFIARDLPASLDLDAIEEMALADLAALESEAQPAKTKKASKAKPVSQTAAAEDTSEEETEAMTDIQPGFMLDYLKRNLEVWDSQPVQPGLGRPAATTNWGDSLRQYANQKRQHEQCCHCNSPLPTGEWMAAQVPGSMGVQSFSNRLEGGSQRDPKRNVCPVCRAQFILEKLAWRSHRDKQGAEQVTFYLHLFPYAFFTGPLLGAWWSSIQNLRDTDSGAFFINTGDYFRQIQAGIKLPRVTGYKTGTNGMGIPTLRSAVSNTPVLPIVAPGDNYGSQFMLALEKAIILAEWFECRVLLTRSPVPIVNLAAEYIGNEPVALMVESLPSNLKWLLPETSLVRENELSTAYGLKELTRRLSLLYGLSEKLYWSKNKKSGDVPHDLAVAAAEDPLALFYEADRLIEKKVDAEKAAAKVKPELQAINLSSQIAPLLEQLLKTK